MPEDAPGKPRNSLQTIDCDVHGIRGLCYQPEWLTAESEERLLHFVDAAPWRGDLSRRVQHYGYIYDYRARRIDPEMYLGPLPPPLNDLAVRLHAEGLFRDKPVQVIVNEYEPGQGIADHIDCPPCFGPQIASVTLHSGCAMQFKRPPKEASLYLAPRSLLLLFGPARRNWTHGIPARKSDVVPSGRVPRARRVSLTFRTVRTS